MVTRKHKHRRQFVTRLFYRCARRIRTSAGNGRSNSGCIYTRFSRQRNCNSDNDDGIHSKLLTDRIRKSAAASAAFYRKRLGHCNGNLCNNIYAVSFSVFNDLYYNIQRNKELEMDCSWIFTPDRHRHTVVYARFSFAEGIYLIKQGMQCNKTMLHTRYFFIYQKRLFYAAFIFYPISCRRAIVNTFAHTDKGFDVCKVVYIYASIKSLQIRVVSVSRICLFRCITCCLLLMYSFLLNMLIQGPQDEASRQGDISDMQH